MSSLRSEPQVQARVCHQRLQCQLCRWAPWGVTRELLKEGIITLPAGPSLDTLDYWTDVVQKMTQFPSLSDFVHGAYLNQGTGGVVNNGFWTWAPHEIAKRMANFDNWRCARKSELTLPTVVQYRYVHGFVLRKGHLRCQNGGLRDSAGGAELRELKVKKSPKVGAWKVQWIHRKRQPR